MFQPIHAVWIFNKRIILLLIILNVPALSTMWFQIEKFQFFLSPFPIITTHTDSIEVFVVVELINDLTFTNHRWIRNSEGWKVVLYKKRAKGVESCHDYSFIIELTPSSCCWFPYVSIFIQSPTVPRHTLPHTTRVFQRRNRKSEGGVKRPSIHPQTKGSLCVPTLYTTQCHIQL